MTAVHERIYRTADGTHVLEDDEHAAYLAYPAGVDVPDDVLTELAGKVTPAPEPEPEVVVEPAPEPDPAGSRLRVFATEDGRHVLEGHPDAAFLVYHQDQDVPEPVLLELATEPAAAAADDEQKAAEPASNKARKPAANKSA